MQNLMKLNTPGDIIMTEMAGALKIQKNIGFWGRR